MQDLMHDYEQVVTAPLRVGRHKLCHYLIDLFYDVHSQQFFKFNFTWCNDRSDNLQCGGIELSMTNLEVLKEDLDEA